jgi:hypothetical protein
MNFILALSVKDRFLNRDFSTKIGGLIDILPGTTLRITNEAIIQFADSKQIGHPVGILVEEGAKLVIENNAILTSLDDCPTSIWDGIKVWGNPNQPQNATYQGKVSLINGAIIENARIAIYQGGDDCCSKSGGIIQATNSTFRNNRKDVAFMQYTKANSASYFYKCTFETTQPMNSVDYTDNHNRRLGTNQHVSIWGQKGVRFYDCQFTTVENYTFNGVGGHFDKDIRSSGITSVDADFQVFSTDTDDEDNRTEFNNQKFGISALKTIGGLRSFKISNALFDNCQYGIRSELATNDLIDNNRFLVQDDLEHGDPINGLGNLNSRYGLYEVNSIRYSIANNTFTSKSGSGFNALYTYGTVVRGQNTGETGFGNVYSNTFENVRRATQTEFHNWWTQIRCNDYNNGIEQEWLINPQGQLGSLNDQGTSCQVPFGIRAGNKFMNPTLAIRDRSEFPWKYWGSGDENTSTVPSMNSDNGSSSVPCGIPGDTPCEIEGGGGDFQLVMMQMQQQIDSNQVELDSIIANLDNGQTDSLLTHLADSTYSNSNLISELQANGLLSDSVLLAVIIRNPSFSDNSFTSLIVQNAPVGSKVWKKVLEKSANFKQENKDTLLYAQTYNTLRTVQQIKWDKRAAQTQWYDAVGKILSGYALADTTAEMHDTIFSFLADTLGHNKTFQKLAIGYGLESDRISEARMLLDSMNLADAADSSFYHYYDLAISLAEDSLTWFGMDSTQNEKIREISTKEFDEANLAQAVLSLIEDTTFIRTPEPLPEDSAEYRLEPTAQIQPQSENQTAKKVKVYPNPFENSFKVAYDLGEDGDIHIEVFDIVGRSVKIMLLNKVQVGTAFVDLSQCLGVYYVRVTNGNKQLFNGKMICLNK